MQGTAVFTSEPPDVWIDICPDEGKGGVTRQRDQESSLEALLRLGWEPVGPFERIGDQLTVAIEQRECHLGNIPRPDVLWWHTAKEADRFGIPAASHFVLVNATTRRVVSISRLTNRQEQLVGQAISMDANS
jgi:hypothetical protein